MGHLYRTMNLAKAFAERNIPLLFVINDHEPALGLIAGHGHRFEVAPLEDMTTGWEEDIIVRHGIRLWINDRLNTGRRHGERIKGMGLPLVTFDDRGEGAAFADLNVAALIFEELDTLSGKTVLQGPDYLILNPEVVRYQRLRSRVGSILVTLGGSDTYGVTVKVVQMLADRGERATVVVGPGFTHQHELAAVMPSSFTLKQGVPSLIAEFYQHDLAITGGGITPFEANASGLPCIVIANEYFEIPVGKTLALLGSAVFAGHHSEIQPGVFAKPLPIESMSRAGMDHVGLEGTHRVVEAISGYL
jgi:spore coat polysaccharide biosynthesis predicted glycosyltransferase SpsG